MGSLREEINNHSAEIVLIENKTVNAHEPYFWVAFSLIGDFR